MILNPKANILIDDDGHALLAEFDLANFADTTPATSSIHQGSAVAWIAPKLLCPEALGSHSSEPSYVSNIYSYVSVC